MREEETQESINQRIIFLINHFEDGNKSAFGRRVGVQSGVVGDLVGGRLNKPSFDNLLKILEAYPLVNTEWLVQGIGPMLKEPTETKNVQDSGTPPLRHQKGGMLEILTVQVGPDGDENIEVVNTRAAAGYPQNRIDQEYIGKLPSFRLPGAPYNQGSFRAFQVSGDSMEPTLRDGDWLICRAVENWGRDMRDNRVYVVVTEEDVLVKRVINQFNERGQITLESDNRAFGVRFLDGGLVGEIWEGVARLTRNLSAPKVDVADELARHRVDIEELFQRLSQAGL